LVVKGGRIFRLIITIGIVTVIDISDASGQCCRSGEGKSKNNTIAELGLAIFADFFGGWRI